MPKIEIFNRNTRELAQLELPLFEVQMLADMCSNAWVSKDWDWASKDTFPPRKRTWRE